MIVELTLEVMISIMWQLWRKSKDKRSTCSHCSTISLKNKALFAGAISISLDTHEMWQITGEQSAMLVSQYSGKKTNSQFWPAETGSSPVWVNQPFELMFSLLELVGFPQISGHFCLMALMVLMEWMIRSWLDIPGHTWFPLAVIWIGCCIILYRRTLSAWIERGCNFPRGC